MFFAPFRLLGQGGVLFFIAFLASAGAVWVMWQETQHAIGPFLAALIRGVNDSTELVSWGLWAFRALVWLIVFPLIVSVSALSIRLLFLSGRWPLGGFLANLPGAIGSAYASLWRILQIWQVYFVPILAVFLLKIIITKYDLEGQMPYANSVISTAVVAWVVFRLLPYLLLPFVMTIGGFDIEYAKSFAFHLIQHYRSYFVMIILIGAAIIFGSTLICDTLPKLRALKEPILYSISVYLTYVLGCATVVKIAEVEVAQKQSRPT